jgi:hypothetical protein
MLNEEMVKNIKISKMEFTEAIEKVLKGADIAKKAEKGLEEMYR